MRGSSSTSARPGGRDPGGKVADIDRGQAAIRGGRHLDDQFPGPLPGRWPALRG
ncbi:MAG: hypothetical protein ACRDPO_18925 [Streptosporangiaceae bacterium]